MPKIFSKMANNGSPKPIFETDEDRSYFLVRLPVHKKVAELEQANEQVDHQATPEVTPEVRQFLVAISVCLQFVALHLSRLRMMNCKRLVQLIN